MALVRAADADVASAQASRQAANARQIAGRADMGDVLQADTAVVRARRARRAAAGQVDVLRGVLAVQIGLPPSGKVDVMPLDDDDDDDATVMTQDAEHCQPRR
jgi:outer membrane protein TolC